jgi:hypothetical protein
MNEIFLLVLAIAGVFSIACSIALISLGAIIDRFPLGDESNRKRSLSSPIESTRIAVVIYWALFIIGGYAILLESKYAIIIGITTIFSGILFMFTALILSFAVLHAMRRRRTRMETPVLQAGPVSVASPAEAPVEGIKIIPKKQYRRPVSNFMVDALMKRD